MIPQKLSARFLSLVVFAVFAAANGPMPIAAAAEPVAVHVRDGRVLTGAVDFRTDEDLFWLRRAAPSILVAIALPWTEITEARYGGRVLSPAEFQELAEELKSKPPAEILLSKPTEQPGAVQPNLPPPAVREAPEGSRRQVQSLRIEAALANWDATVEADGLRLRVYPLDAQGGLAPLDGSLDVRLIGRRLDETRRGGRFVELGRWAEEVRIEDFGEWGADYRLAFQQLHPEFDLDVSAEGLLNVRLGAPGQGVFEASVPVWLRTYSPVRDQLQRRQGRRFFPDEATGRSAP